MNASTPRKPRSSRKPSGPTPPDLHYQVEVLNANSHLFAVTLTVQRPAARQRVSLPVWIPGSYLVREFAQHLQHLRATQGGEPVALRQLDKHTWQASAQTDQPLSFTYEVYAFDASVRTAFLDSTRGFFNATSLCLRVLLVVLAVMTLIAGLDFLFQRLQHSKQLRMSKQELKDEFKQSEGDPMVRGRLRQIRMERARRRMMAAVPEADVVIANPTHFAVALAYEVGTVGAPRVTAKGMDHLALKIRELAEQHGIPVIENPPLARALFDGVALDQEIPEQHYKAVAEIIGYVLRLKGKLPGRATPPPPSASAALPPDAS